MQAIELVGRDEAWGRDLFVVSIPTATSLPHELRLTTPWFVCLLAWNARGASVGEISALAQRLLDAGAVYVCTWGQDCEPVHDIFDEERDRRSGADAGSAVVMTTWHDNESLADVLGFVLAAAIPDDAYARECGSTLAVSIGSTQWADEMREAFWWSRAFVSEWASGSE